MCCKLNLQIIGCRSGFPVHRQQQLQQQQQRILHSHKCSDASDVWQHKQTAGLSWRLSLSLSRSSSASFSCTSSRSSTVWQAQWKLIQCAKVRRPLPPFMPTRAAVQESRLEMAQSTENGLVHIWTVMALWVATWPQTIVWHLRFEAKCQSDSGCFTVKRLSTRRHQTPSWADPTSPRRRCFTNMTPKWVD